MKKFIVIAMIAFAMPAFAADIKTEQTLDINEAVRLTIQNNNSLRSLRQEMKKAEAFKLQASGVWLPNITASGSVNDQRVPQTTDGSERHDGRSVTATVTESIYTGGKNSALQAQVPHKLTIAESVIADGENSAIGELYGRFYNVILKREQIKAEQAAVKTSEIHLEEVKKMAELGLANRLELIRAAQQLASNGADLAVAEGQYNNALISLMNYMAIDPQNARHTVGELYTPRHAGDRATSIAAAREHRADLKKLAAQIGLQEQQITIEKSSLRPQVTAGVSAGAQSPFRNVDQSGDTWKAELSLSIPIFDRYKTQSAVKSAEAVLEQNKISYEQKELDLKSEVETAWNTVESSYKTLKAQEHTLKLAEESLRLAEIGYKEGVTPQLDLLSAQQSFTEAQCDYNSLQYTHLIAVVALKVTEGTILQWSGDR